MNELDALVNSLCIIASTFEIQKSYYPKYVILGDELASELECIDFFKDKLLTEKQLSQDILNEILEIDQNFISISRGEEKYTDEIWQDLAIKTDPFWQEQRNRALKVLEKMGMGYHIPRTQGMA